MVDKYGFKILEYDRDILVDSLEQLGCDVEDTVKLSLFHCPACQNPNEKLDKEE